MKNLFRCALILLLGVGMQLPTLAIPYSIIAEVERLAEVDESFSYNYSVSLGRLLIPADTREASIKLFSPQGQQFIEHPFPGSVLAKGKSISPEQIDAIFAGTWRIEEAFAGGAIEQYQFTIPSVVDSNRFPSPPVITSPTDGSAVDREFDLLFTVPADAENSGGTRSTITPFAPTPGALASLQRQGTAPGEINYLARGDFSGKNVTMRVSASGDSIKGFPVTPLTPGADAEFRFSFLNFDTFSESITFSVVPEPSSFVLTLLCSVVGLNRRSS